MKKFSRIIAAYMLAVFVLGTLVGCSYAAPTPVATLPKLDTPVVTVDAEGVASWGKVDNAIYYVYVIDEGEEHIIDVRHVQLKHNDSVKVKAVSGSELYNDSEFSLYKTYIKSNTPPDDDPPDDDPPAKIKLTAPIVTIDDDGLATWNSISGASAYVYVINDGAEQSTVARSVQLQSDDSIKVKAVSDEEQYGDSDYSPVVKYVKGAPPIVKTKLTTPTVTIDDNGVATWGSISGASAYVYVINGGSENTTDARLVRLADSDSIKVKAVSDSELYTDSDFSAVKTYVKSTPPPVVKTKLTTPTVTIDDDGLATWNSISDANSYAYVINSGSEKTTTSRSVQLQNNDSIKVKALSGGEEYVDSDYSAVKTYVQSTKPDVDPPKLSEEAKAYYSDITAKTADSLLGQLHDLITKTHKKYTTYNDCKDPTIIVKTDQGSTANYVMDFYTQRDMSSSWGSGAVGTWNREHVWCQSLSNGMWGESYGGSDLHHIRPTESTLNSSRSNNKFGVVNGGTPAYFKDTNKNEVCIGGYRQGSATFEPLDKVKGDVARIVMYVYTHYNTYANVHGTTNGSGGKFGTLNFTHVVTASSEQAAKALMLQWSLADPVDEIEMARNEAVYKIQGNRNPFIDHPEYAVAIWG